ncbi:MAG: hypothetical protein GXO85_13305, partial [Chlorobi bacterium]|nr:hypothetical protein [Chlorobiota bacterium]
MLIGKSSSLQLKRSSTDKKYSIIKAKPWLTIRFFAFSMDNKSPLTSNKLLRKAIVEAYNRNKFSDTDDVDNLTNTLVPSHLLGFNLEEHPYNLSNAKKIVSELPDKIKSKVYTVCSSIKSRDAELLVEGMRNIGLKVKLDVHAKNYYRSIMNDRPDIFRVSMMPSFPDPTEYYALFYSKSGKDNNLAQYNN